MSLKAGDGKRGRKSDPAALYGTYPEACARYGLGETTIRSLIREAKIRGITVGKRALVDFRSADEYFASLPTAARKNAA